MSFQATILQTQEQEWERQCLEKSVSSHYVFRIVIAGWGICGLKADSLPLAYFDPESESRQQRVERLAKEAQNGADLVVGREKEQNGNVNGSNGATNGVSDSGNGVTGNGVGKEDSNGHAENGAVNGAA